MKCYGLLYLLRRILQRGTRFLRRKTEIRFAKLETLTTAGGIGIAESSAPTCPLTCFEQTSRRFRGSWQSFVDDCRRRLSHQYYLESNNANNFASSGTGAYPTSAENQDQLTQQFYELNYLLQTAVNSAKTAFTYLIDGDTQNGYGLLKTWKAEQRRQVIGPLDYLLRGIIYLDNDLEPKLERFGAELHELDAALTACAAVFGECVNWAVPSVRPAVTHLVNTLQGQCDEIFHLIGWFVWECLIVVKQPPPHHVQQKATSEEKQEAQAAKAGGAKLAKKMLYPFTPVLRLLGGRALGFQNTNNAQVACHFVSETEKNCLKEVPNIIRKSPHDSGAAAAQIRPITIPITVANLTNNKVYGFHNIFENEPRWYCADFRQNIKMNLKKQLQDVEKSRYYAVFEVSRLDSAHHHISGCKISMPFGLCTSPDQRKKCDFQIAFARVFPTMGRELTDQLSWPAMGNVLQLKFMQLIQLGSDSAVEPMCQESVDGLAEMIFGTQINYNKCRMSVGQLMGRTVCGGGGSMPKVMDVFSEAAEMVREQLLPCWNNGGIVGFMTKGQAQAKLGQCTENTLLIRFSTSQSKLLMLHFYYPRNLADSGEKMKTFTINGQDLAQASFLKALRSVRSDMENMQLLWPQRPIEQLIFPHHAKANNVDLLTSDVRAQLFVSLGPAKAKRRDSTTASRPNPYDGDVQRIQLRMEYVAKSVDETDDFLDDFFEAAPFDTTNFTATSKPAPLEQRRRYFSCSQCGHANLVEWPTAQPSAGLAGEGLSQLSIDEGHLFGLPSPAYSEATSIAQSSPLFLYLAQQEPAFALTPDNQNQ